MRFITSCVDVPISHVNQLQEMIDRSREVSYRTARAHIGAEALAKAFPNYDWRRRPRDLTLKDDWHVTYHRSVFRGKPVYYLVHSAIEYIFAED